MSEKEFIGHIRPLKDLHLWALNTLTKIMEPIVLNKHKLYPISRIILRKNKTVADIYFPIGLPYPHQDLQTIVKMDEIELFEIKNIEIHTEEDD